MNYYSYVSTRTGCDAVPTVFLCPPSADAASLSAAERFAEQSGWKQKAEEMAAVLIVPVVERGWQAESPDLLMDLYKSEKGKFRAPSGESIPGRDGALWLWETVLYGAGYGDGATFLGNTVVAHPGFLAATALVGQGPDNYDAGNAPSEHWLVADPKDYHVRNFEIPVAVDLYGNDPTLRRAAYWFRKNTAASRVRSFDRSDPTPQEIFVTLFDTTIRWKNGPDGTLASYCGRAAFEAEGRYRHGKVSTGEQEYPYAVYLPKGAPEEGADELAVVFNIHGRGEPAWLFAEKNGWHTLTDETKEFMVVTPDSFGNIWTIDRDYDALKAILNDLTEHYRFDHSRVYLTGFSNGAVFTAQQATTHPELFAAASPWNGPFIDRFVYEPGFPESGYKMPFFVCAGDSDDKASATGPQREAEIDLLLKASGCVREKGEHIAQGRFDTTVYRDEQGVPMVAYTVMKNMPHGSIVEQSRAAWDFMRKFRRPDEEREVQYEGNAV